MPFFFFWRGQREIINVTLNPPVPGSYTIQELPGSTPQQVAIRNRWLGGKNFEIGRQKAEAGNWKIETGKWKLETGIEKLNLESLSLSF